MVDLFSNYIKNIAVCIIFSAFVEMLIPDNDFKKYINLVLGFIVILVVLNPLKSILFKSYPLDIQVFNKASDIENNSLLKEKNLYESKQKDLIITTYKSQLEDQIKALISKQSNLNVNSINIEVNEDYESDEFAQIKKIEVVATEAQISNQNQTTINPIDKITISNTALQDDTTENRNNEIEKNLESLISDFYKLNQDNIYIIVHRN